MATWTNIPDSVLEPGKPVRSVDALALRDNPIAIAEGASGAPRIAGQQGPAVHTGGIANSAVTTAKINNSAVTTAKIANSNVTAGKLATGGGENNWVRARTATSATGAVGTYALLRKSGTTSVGPTEPGSSLLYSNGAGNGAGSPAGTWRAMGFGGGANNDPEERTTLWLRIS